MIRSSSINDLINAVRQPEYASLYESLQQVIPHLDNIDALAGEEFDQLIASLEEAKDFSGITVVNGSPAAWDPVTKILTVPTVKGDKGDTGQVGPAGPRGSVGPAGEKGTSLTIVSIIDIGNGKLQIQFNDGTTYTTPDLRGPEGQVGAIGPQGVGVNHIIATSTTEPHGNYGETGEVDTYSLYGDDDQTILLGSFQIANGIDPYKVAADAGYSGSKEAYYLLLGDAYIRMHDIIEYADSAEQNRIIAENSANAAAISEDSAAQSAEEAAISENNSALSAQAEAISESSAQQSAQAASISENNAQQSAYDAAESESLAAQHLAAIEIIYDNFDDRYLGAFSVDPTLDNDGNSLIIGAIYFNTVDNDVKFYKNSLIYFSIYVFFLISQYFFYVD
jgi:hypothetical protein